jgi:hypothetical protein
VLTNLLGRLVPKVGLTSEEEPTRLKEARGSTQPLTGRTGRRRKRLGLGVVARRR